MRLIGTELWIASKDGFLRINVGLIVNALLIASVVSLLAVVLI